MQQLILCTCPDAESAEKIAELLVNQELAACVNILPGGKSIYAWQGKIETAAEHLLLIKSHNTLYSAVETAIKAVHPYQVPEIIAINIAQGATDYLKWIDSCLGIN